MALTLMEWLTDTKKCTEKDLIEYCRAAAPGLSAEQQRELCGCLRDELGRTADRAFKSAGLRESPPPEFKVPPLRSFRAERHIEQECEEMEEQDSSWPLFDVLEKHRGFSDLLSEKTAEKQLAKAKDLGAPAPRGKLVLDPKSRDALSNWIFADPKLKTPPQALWIGVIQIGERTALDHDILFLGRLLEPGEKEDRDLHTLTLKAEQPPPKGLEYVSDKKEKDPQKSKAKAEEHVSPHYRFVKKLAKAKRFSIKDTEWNDGIDLKGYLDAQQAWHRSGCFYGFYMLVDRRGGSRFDFLSSALNWYANGAFGNYVPRAGAHSLVDERHRLAFSRYAQEVKELRIEREELIEVIKEIPGGLHRAHLGANWRGPKSLPIEYAKDVLRLLAAFGTELKKPTK